MGHSLNRTNFKVNNLTILDGLEGSDKILISDSKGLVNWKTPSNYISNKPNSHYIGELFGGGVVVGVWQENGIERCLVAALENISTTTSQNGITSFIYGFAWSNLNLTSGTNYKSFGASNSSIIALQSATSSAQLCLDYLNPDLGTGVWDDWFLPSIYELNYLINNAAIFNKVLDSYSYDKNEPKLDVVNINVIPEFPSFTYTTTSILPSNLNLLNFGKTKYTRNDTTDYGGPFGPVTDTYETTSNDSDYYWSSTEDTSNNAWGVLTGTSSFRNLDIETIPKSTLAKVRPFRIADDTQISFDFEADYIVLTYEFSGERDLDTRTTIITPDLPSSESGFGAYLGNYGWAPDGSTYSVLWHGGDNTGFGYESVLINLNAFKYYYPGQSEIVLDAKAHWYVGNWVPDFTPGDQTRLDNTPPVMLAVDLYQGGNPVKIGYQWQNPTAGASMSLNSVGVVVNTQAYAGPGTGQRVAKFKYNVIGKFGYLFSI